MHRTYVGVIALAVSALLGGWALAQDSAPGEGAGWTGITEPAEVIEARRVLMIELERAVARLGQWIRQGKARGAKPLGIHLEGPFIAPEACGAHPPGTIRPLSFPELDALYERIVALQKTSNNPVASFFINIGGNYSNAIELYS